MKITNKSQISIFNDQNTAVVQRHFTYPDLPVMMPLGTTGNRSFVWNFEFGSLGFV